MGAFSDRKINEDIKHCTRKDDALKRMMGGGGGAELTCVRLKDGFLRHGQLAHLAVAGGTDAETPQVKKLRWDKTTFSLPHFSRN